MMMFLIDFVQSLLQELDVDLYRHMDTLHVGDMTFCHRYVTCCQCVCYLIRVERYLLHIQCHFIDVLLHTDGYYWLSRENLMR